MAPSAVPNLFLSSSYFFVKGKHRVVVRIRGDNRAEDWQASDCHEVLVNIATVTRGTVSGRYFIFPFRRGGVPVDKWEHDVPFCTGSDPVPGPDECGRDPPVHDTGTHR